MEDNTIYPEPVIERGKELLEGLRESGYLEPEAEMDENVLLEGLCKFFLNKFINGDELSITEEECDEVYGLAGINTTINGLIAKGVLNTIENENREDILFLTEKGKKIRDEI